MWVNTVLMPRDFLLVYAAIMVSINVKHKTYAFEYTPEFIEDLRSYKQFIRARISTDHMNAVCTYLTGKGMNCSEFMRIFDDYDTTKKPA